MFLLSGDIQENIKYIYLNKPIPKPNRPMWILDIGRYLYVKNQQTFVCSRNWKARMR